MPEDNSEQSAQKPRLTVSELKRFVTSAYVEAQGALERGEYETDSTRVFTQAQEEYQHLLGLRDHYNHKRKWSWFLLGLIAFMIFFQSGVIVAVGRDLLNLDDYEWLLPALLVQNLAQIIGLAVFVVRSLFSSLR